MIGKPEWFRPRKFGWGLGIRSWQGIAYIMVVAALYGALFAAPLDSGLRIILAIALSAVVIADIMHIMYKVYSNLDEREERHQLVAERNASFTAIAALMAYVLYVTFSASLSSSVPDFSAMALPLGILVSMSLAKGATLMLLEREG